MKGNQLQISSTGISIKASEEDSHFWKEQIIDALEVHGYSTVLLREESDEYFHTFVRDDDTLTLKCLSTGEIDVSTENVFKLFESIVPYLEGKLNTKFECDVQKFAKRPTLEEDSDTEDDSDTDEDSDTKEDRDTREIQTSSRLHSHGGLFDQTSQRPLVNTEEDSDIEEDSDTKQDRDTKFEHDTEEDHHTKLDHDTQERYKHLPGGTVMADYLTKRRKEKFTFPINLTLFTKLDEIRRTSWKEAPIPRLRTALHQSMYGSQVVHPFFLTLQRDMSSLGRQLGRISDELRWLKAKAETVKEELLTFKYAKRDVRLHGAIYPRPFFTY